MEKEQMDSTEDALDSHRFKLFDIIAGVTVASVVTLGKVR